MAEEPKKKTGNTDKTKIIKHATSEKPAKKSLPKAKEESDEYTPDLSFLPIWAKKAKTSVEKLEKTLKDTVADIKSVHKDWAEDKIWDKARQRVYATFKGDMKSSASEWYIRVDSPGDAFDYGNAEYQKHKDAYEKNPANALKKKMVKVQTDATGKKRQIIPTDSNEKLKYDKTKANPNFGKPIAEHAWIRSIWGLGIPSEKQEKDDWKFLKPSLITVSKGQADPESKAYLNFEMGKWYKVKLTNKTAKDNTEYWDLGTSASVSKIEEIDGFDIKIEDIPEYYEGFYASLGELNEYHDTYAEPDKNKPDEKTVSRRLVVTKGTVSSIVESEDGKSNTKIEIDDESLGFQENPESVVCWFPASREIPFGKLSEVYIFGDTTRTLKKDLATNELTDEWGLTSISMKGFIVIDLVEPEVEDEEAGNDDDEVEEDEEEITLDPDEEEKEDEEESDNETAEDEEDAKADAEETEDETEELEEKKEVKKTSSKKGKTTKKEEVKEEPEEEITEEEETELKEALEETAKPTNKKKTNPKVEDW
jgi:hypothetical protein